VNGATACALHRELRRAQRNEDRSVSGAGHEEGFAAIRPNVDRIRQRERMVCDLHDAQPLDGCRHVGDLAVEKRNDVGVPDVNLIEGVFRRRDEDAVARATEQAGGKQRNRVPTKRHAGFTAHFSYRTIAYPRPPWNKQGTVRALGVNGDGRIAGCLK
jgi:hypothetical protein